MMKTLPRVWVITGLMAAGKSTAAQGLAERLPKSVHVRGDVFRKMIVNGRMDMSPDPSEEAVEQLSLRHRLACGVVAGYADAGFFVVYQDILLGEHLNGVVQALSAYRPCVIVLNPHLEVVARRDQGRTKTVYGATWSPATLAAGLAQTPRIGLWLDTSAMSVAETVDYILAHAEDARA